ncbi:tRNA splicing endonuclease subunit SEN2 [Aspergillus ibericus CBS 121593]|uniref:tRNA-splicing endonuclease subunit Sen2 n=1 Tax=Aspergillus ibericus CBS 121593 TaxID=1448316 RepID=A0A395H2T7_9EURO|nr:tRNA-splicing endonuclease subunit Sen2 [Aspergillus ibericus CBS 121593]RAL01973.1 tRNA-splicing endonuclease subunit Sen2 [Aspergillus ibericus CBS 121593]
MASSNSLPRPAPETAAPGKSESSQNHASPARPSRPARPPRPNYRLIHRFPFPVEVHPLPPLIPHNPLSLVSVLLSYLTYFISPPHQEIYSAYFDTATSSVHVTDPKAIKALWEMGFFGKGTLSRSEPSWLEREKKRRGLLGGMTSEEVTRQRRTERRELKLERARMEKLAIEERLKAEAAAREGGMMPPEQSVLSPTPNGVTDGTIPVTEKFSLRKAREARLLESQRAVSQDGSVHPPTPLGKRTPSGNKTVRFSPVVQAKEFVSDSVISSLPEKPVDRQEANEEPVLNNEEHLQLSTEEAFFLVYGLGVLRVLDDTRTDVIPTSSLLPLLCRHSYFPPRDPSVDLTPDDPFMISYVVYHHFRSLGWVVRSGVKFGVDYILYNRGPVFSHAEFAVVVVPSYSHSYWSETAERRAHSEEKMARSWWWLHCVNRVQAQVKKSLVVCYVEVPPPTSYELDTPCEGDIGAMLGRYQVREMVIRRWVPNRTRD